MYACMLVCFSSCVQNCWCWSGSLCFAEIQLICYPVLWWSMPGFLMVCWFWWPNLWRSIISWHLYWPTMDGTCQLCFFFHVWIIVYLWRPYLHRKSSLESKWYRRREDQQELLPGKSGELVMSWRSWYPETEACSLFRGSESEWHRVERPMIKLFRRVRECVLSEIIGIQLHIF
jgi:hypothetical protein